MLTSTETCIERILVVQMELKFAAKQMQLNATKTKWKMASVILTVRRIVCMTTNEPDENLNMF